MTNREKFLDKILAREFCHVIRKMRTGGERCRWECEECEKENLEWLMEDCDRPQGEQERRKIDWRDYCKQMQDLDRIGYCPKQRT